MTSVQMIDKLKEMLWFGYINVPSGDFVQAIAVLMQSENPNFTIGYCVDYVNREFASVGSFFQS